jgi:hypothetical protein
MANSELIQRITDFLSSSSEDISKKELTAEISKIYDELKKPEKKEKKEKKQKKEKKDDDEEEKEEKEEKKKREPTAYNIFMKEQMAKLKEEETDDNKMSGKEKMSHIAVLWKQKKELDGK